MAASTASPNVTAAARAGVDLRLGEFFRYHGWLSPGVRLFRQIGFPAKSIWIAAAFVLPMLVMLAMLVVDESAQVDFSRSERAGVATMRGLLTVIDAAQARRHAAVMGAPDLTELQAKVGAAFELLERDSAKFAGQEAVKNVLAKLKAAHAKLIAAPTAATPDKTFAAHDELVDNLLKLAREIANASNLALDPDLDTYHLMNVAVLRGPSQYESVDMLRTTAARALQTRSLTDSQRDVLTKNLAVWEYVDEEVESSYRTGIAGDAALANRLDMKTVDAAADAFVTSLRMQVLDGELAGNADALARAGDEARRREATLVHQVLEELDGRLQARIDRLHATMAWLVGIASFFVAIAAYLLLCFYRVMMGGLSEVDNHLREITRGNLTTAPTPWGKDEAARLMTTMGEMQASLRRIVGIVLDGSAAVDTASQEIAAASRDLSTRTEQTAANLEETSSTMEQISATVRQTAATVADAKVVVDRNAVAATHGGEVIGEVVKTMNAIQVSSRRIGEIIGVIDGIAFQTNILALNAAVEAARAGDQGRGFAVVASEVRALAGRSAEAAREIKSLITASTEQVDAGTRVAADAGQTIAGLVESSHAIGGLIANVAGSAHEQSLGVGQVSEAVQGLDRSTQQNAALVEQTSAAANTLSSQARRLAEEISFFRLR